MKWVNDEAAQVVLLDMGIETREEVVSVADIDKKKSAENRARAKALDETRIDGISAAAEKGVPIPKIVVRSRPDGTYVIAGGNHRFAACENKVSIPSHVINWIPVHVINCTDAEFETACRVLNTVVGVGMTKAERVAAAVNDVQRLGITQATAASLYGLHASDVSTGVMDLVIARRIASVLPANAAKKVTKTHIRRLGDLSKNDNILKAACELVIVGKCKTEEIADLTREAKKKKTEAEQLAVFADALQMRRSSEGKKIPRKKRSEFAGTIKRIKNLAEVKSWAALEIEPEEVETWKRAVKESVHILQTLLQVDG
jgi:hypothetical protein